MAKVVEHVCEEVHVSKKVVRNVVLKCPSSKLSPKALRVLVVLISAFAINHSIVELLARQECKFIQSVKIVYVVVTEKSFELHQLDRFVGRKRR